VPRVLSALREVEARLQTGEVASNVQTMQTMGVLALIEELQEHVDERVYEEASRLLDHYLGAEEPEPEP